MKVYVYKCEQTEYVEKFPNVVDMGDMGLYCIPVNQIEWASLHKQSDGKALICETVMDYVVIELANIFKIVD